MTEPGEIKAETPSSPVKSPSKSMKDRDRSDKDGGRSRDRDRRSRDHDRERSSREHRSRDRDRDRERDRSSRDRSPERRDRDRKRSSRGSSSDKRSRSRSRSPRRAPEPAPAPAGRPELTVFVSAIHPKIKERDLFEFFASHGRVEDVRIIRDSRTKKSKGLAYVEFHALEDVQRAVAMNGQLLGGYPVQIQLQQAPPPSATPTSASSDSMRLYVGSLQYQITEEDLRPFFAAFGDLDSIEIHKDPATGTSKGFGFVQYRRSADAKVALQALNGVEVGGRPVKVGLATQAGSGPQGPLPGQPGMPGSYMPGPSMAPLGVLVPPLQPPTPFLLIANMFDPMQEREPNWHEDIADELRAEADPHGKLRFIYVDRVNPAGYVLMQFADVESSMDAFQSLNQRWFAQRQLKATFLKEAEFASRLPANIAHR